MSGHDVLQLLVGALDAVLLIFVVATGVAIVKARIKGQVGVAVLSAVILFMEIFVGVVVTAVAA